MLVDRPDHGGRLAILRVHVKKIVLAAEVDLDQVASLTTGFTGADLANLVNEAAIVATRRRSDSVTLDDFTQAIERIVAGLEKKSRVLSKAERRRVAYHEMGHALVASTLPGVDPVQKVSIIPAASAPWATPCSARPRTGSYWPARTWKTASPSCWVAAPPSR